MGKTAILNLRVNPTVKQRAEDVLKRLEMPKAPASVNTDVMSINEIHAKLQEGYDDINVGKVQDAAEAFARFRESH